MADEQFQDFSLDGAAILFEAPDYDTAIADLVDSYSNHAFEDEEKAQQALEQYGTLLSEKFRDISYPYSKSKELLPVPQDTVEGDSDFQRINAWEKANEEEITKSKDPLIIAMRQKLLMSTKRAAISERRILNGKDSLDDFEQRQRDVYEGESYAGMLARKAIGGFIPGGASLLGYHENEEYFAAEDPNRSYGEKLGGDVATGVGLGGRILAGAGAGAAGGAALGAGVGAVPGALIGAGAVMLPEIVSAIKGAYERSEEATGDPTRAAGAATIEAVSQTAQLVMGGKAIGSVASKVVGRTLGPVLTETVKAAEIGAVTGYVGGTLSEAANQVGTGELDTIELLKAGPRGASAGGVAGTIVGGAAAYRGGSKMAPAPDQFKSETNVLPADNLPDGVTNDVPTATKQGVSEVSKAEQTVTMPYDQTHTVSEENAAKIQRLKESVNPEGEPIKIYTDNHGRLVIDDPYVSPDFELQNTRQDSGPVFVPSEGDVLVGANKPRGMADGATEYNSKVLGKSGGAAFIEEFGKERGFAKKIRTNPLIADELANTFGDRDGPGLSRYDPFRQAELTDETQVRIKEQGLEKSVSDFLSQMPDYGIYETEKTGTVLYNNLMDIYAQAVEAGDTAGAAAARKLADDVLWHHAYRGTPLGQGLAARRNFKSPLAETVEVTEALSYQDAVKSVAREEQIPIRDVQNTEAELKTVDNQIQELSKQADPEILKIDKDLQDTDTLISKLNEEADTRVKDIQQKMDEKIKLAETEIGELEKQLAEKDKKLTETVKKVDEEIKQLEESAKKAAEDYNKKLYDQTQTLKDEIRKLEEKGRTEAQKQKQKELDLATTTLDKLKKNKEKGAKVDDKVLAEGERRVQKAKSTAVSPEEGLTAAEKKLYHQYQKDQKALADKSKANVDNIQKAPERKRLEKLRNLKTEYDKAKLTLPVPKERARIDALQNFIKDQTEAKNTVTPKTVLPKAQSTKLGKLTEAKTKLETRKSELTSKFDEVQKERYKELTAKKDRLQTRTKKIRESAKQKFDEALPAEKVKQLREFSAALDALPEDSPARPYVHAKIDEIRHDAARTYTGKLKTLTDDLITLIQAQRLASIATQGTNIGANLGRAALAPVSLGVTGVGGVLANIASKAFGTGKVVSGMHPMDGILWLSTFVKSTFEQGIPEARAILKTGREINKPRLDTSKGDIKIQKDSPNTYELVDDGKGNLSLKQSPNAHEDPIARIARIPVLGKKSIKGFPGLNFQWVGIALRALGSGDALFRGAIDAEAAVAISQEARLKNLSGTERRNYIAEKLFATETLKAEAMQKAEADAATLKKIGIELSKDDIISNAWRLMEQQRSEDIRKTALYSAGIDFLSPDSHPHGIMGFMTRHFTAALNSDIPIGNGKKIVNVGKVFQPFTNMAFKVAGLMIDTSPVGLLKAASGKLQGENSQVVRKQMGSAIIGTTLLSVLMAAADQDESDNPWFTIIGAIPTKASDRDLFFAKQWKPYSFKFGENIVQFQDSPLMGALAPVAAYLDRKRYDKNFNKDDAMSVLGTLVAGSLTSYKDIRVLKSLQDGVEALSHPERAVDILKDTVAGLLKDTFVGYHRPLSEINRAFENPITTRNNFWAKVVENVPFVNVSGKPVLNLFGEPVARDWYSKVPFLGSFTDRFYGQMTNDPDILWMVNHGYTHLGVEYKVTLPSEGHKWDWLKAKRAEKLGAAFDDVLTDEEQYKLQELVGPKYRQIVDRYRKTYGNHKPNEHIQKSMAKEMQSIKSAYKFHLFILGGTKDTLPTE